MVSKSTTDVTDLRFTSRVLAGEISNQKNSCLLPGTVIALNPYVIYDGRYCTVQSFADDDKQESKYLH